MVTATIQIGNTDNKLSQGEWSSFCSCMQAAINDLSDRVHFGGGSSYDAPWQNACWVCDVKGDSIKSLTEAIKDIRVQFSQDSVAVTWGDTSFV